jgi:hypothetical protein
MEEEAMVRIGSSTNIIFIGNERFQDVDIVAHDISPKNKKAGYSIPGFLAPQATRFLELFYPQYSSKYRKYGVWGENING